MWFLILEAWVQAPHWAHRLLKKMKCRIFFVELLCIPWATFFLAMVCSLLRLSGNWEIWFALHLLGNFPTVSNVGLQCFGRGECVRVHVSICALSVVLIICPYETSHSTYGVFMPQHFISSHDSVGWSGSAGAFYRSYLGSARSCTQMLPPHLCMVSSKLAGLLTWHLRTPIVKTLEVGAAIFLRG